MSFLSWCYLMLCFLLTVVADEFCLSCGKTAISDVRGNLGPATVLTDAKTEDWLKHRWQAAKDMSGTPIPGPHWVEVEIVSNFTLTNVLLDWEAAYANDYVIEAAEDGKKEWIVLHDHVKFIREKKKVRSKSEETALMRKFRRNRYRKSGKVHVMDAIKLDRSGKFQFLRLRILAPATKWGSSLWQVIAIGDDDRHQQQKTSISR